MRRNYLPDEQVRLHAALRRNVYDAQEFVASRLSKAGCNDISPDESFLLGVLARNDEAAAAELLPGMEISKQEAAKMIERMRLCGYLRPPGRRACRNQPIVTLTERGLAAVTIGDAAVKAYRWDQFPLREDDIIISTPMKCGTTWTQMICALLIFQTPDLQAPLTELSPWLDANVGFWRETLDGLAAQKHRRFIKTHLPISELPSDPRVTYIVTARNLLDAALSNHNHGTKAMEQQRRSELQPHELTSTHDFLLRWITTDTDVRIAYENLMPRMLEHLADAWQRRHQPNVILLHYEDLSADLEGEMRRIAARLGVSVPETTWPALVKAARFNEMRAAADRVQPEPRLKDAPEKFFRKGASGEGRALLTDAELAYFHGRTARMAPRDFLAWLHRED